jgi:hypothetical protein
MYFACEVRYEREVISGEMSYKWCWCILGYANSVADILVRDPIEMLRPMHVLHDEPKRRAIIRLIFPWLVAPVSKSGWNAERRTHSRCADVVQVVITYQMLIRVNSGTATRGWRGIPEANFTRFRKSEFGKGPKGGM